MWVMKSHSAVSTQLKILFRVQQPRNGFPAHVVSHFA